MEPQDEFIHDYPKPLDAHWKENWYFNFIDRANNAWGINHISLMRHIQKGRFSAFHIIDGEIMLYSNVIDIPDKLPELSDGKLKFEFVEPFKKFKVTFIGPRHEINLDYEARFDVYDYNAGKKPRSDNKKMAMNHYEQGLFVKGSIVKDGKKKQISCYGHRDHSWGYRNESKVTGWNWIAVQFDNMTINMSKVVVGEAYMGNGFVSTKDGNARIFTVNIEDTKFENKLPVSSVFTGVDAKNRKFRLKSEKFSGLVLPMDEKGKGVTVYENFSEFTNLDTGEKGVGIDEYLINPKP